MSLIDRNIYFQKDSQFQLIGSGVRKFIIFSIKKTHYQTIYLKDKQDSFETFLLVKAQPDNPPEKNIVFARQKIQTNELEKCSSESQFLKSQTFYCSFLRHVDLLYCRKLAETLDFLNIRTDAPIENQWFILYEVHGYKPSTCNLMKYELKSPVYGGRVAIENQFYQSTEKLIGTVSNLFRLGSHNIYFVNDSLNKEQIHDMNIVLSQNKTQIYGLTYKTKEDIICIPLNMILFEKPCETIIETSLLDKLQRTCYVSYLGSYCTGILIEENKLITTRHLLPQHQHKLELKVLVKKFPYKENCTGIITRIGLMDLDIMEIQILNKEFDVKPKSSQNLKHKDFVKQYLTGNLNHNEESHVISQSFDIKPNFGKKLFSTQMITLQKKYQLGDPITALGFGKFSYHINIFNKFDIILPTVAFGVVSKIVQISKANIFLKTDAKLYSGFSGCGIWKEEMIGMAVFILKNQTNNSFHNRHNFSYTAQFINSLRKSTKKQFTVRFNKEIEQFDRIQTRYFLELADLPQPKL